jgi:signal transduction histidine kinase
MHSIIFEKTLINNRLAVGISNIWTYRWGAQDRREDGMGDDPNDSSPDNAEQTKEKNGGDFFVIGLGASAGGIKALKEFFARVPPQSGMAYVVILHMSPEHESRLTEILQLTTRIPVTQVVETVRINPDHVYVIPPNRSLSIRDGHLALSQMTRAEERRAPVDIFFRSLAESNDARAVCVILSGTGANGSMGLKRIKELGGIVLAQDPAEAEYDDMPRNAIATGLVDFVMPVAQMPAKIIAYKDHLDEARAHERLSYLDLHLRLLEQFGPPSVLVNENYDIVHLSQRVGRYMQFTGGEPTHNLLRIVRPELRLDLRTALYQAVQKRTNVEARGLYVRINDHTHTVNLIVRPVMRDGDPARGFILVIFEEAHEKEGIEDPLAVDTISQAEPVAHQLEEELVRVKAQLRATIEQYEVQHEELKASNEELQAMNEELRSAAEELETSKEELQSVNEELGTVNQELKIKIEELSQANNDFQNLMSSTGIGTIFLDRSLRVKLFTPRACDIYNLIPTDINRPLMDITSRLLYANLIEDVEDVLDRLQPVEHEVQTREGGWYLVRVVPYRTKEDRIDGVVITFIDITMRKAAAETLRRTRDELETRVKERTGLQIANESLQKEIIERRDAVKRGRGLLQRIVTAQEDERSRIARNLHDHLGQQLTALRLNLEALKDKGGNQTEINQEIEQAQIIAKQLDIDVDFLSWELRPVALDNLDLATALSHFVQEWSKHFNIPAEFHSSHMEIGRYPQDIETNLYRIVQEALNNIYKHAQATRVDVIFECQEDHIALIIEDNGQGFDMNNVAVHIEEEKGMGLIGMRERAALVGGTIEIESRPGDGTTIIVRAPISSAEEGVEERGLL